ncbi:MAG: DUF2887 domain-containing protein, partial [bacterium]
MQIDLFFYRLLLDFPEVFFALIGEDKQKAKTYEFKSILYLRQHKP